MQPNDAFAALALPAALIGSDRSVASVNASWKEWAADADALWAGAGVGALAEHLGSPGLVVAVDQVLTARRDHFVVAVPVRPGASITGLRTRDGVLVVVDDAPAGGDLGPAAGAAKDQVEFVATISHELRTPLQSLTGAVDLLGSGDAAQDARLLVVIRRSSEMLRELIQDAQDFARVEAGAIEVRLDKVDVPALVRETAEMFQPAAAERRVSLGVVSAPDIPRLVTDPLRVRQVLGHLLDNAVRHTTDGAVEVHVGRVEEGVELLVRDAGTGIDAGVRGHLFEPFTHWQDDESGHAAGAGLGLAVSARLARLLGGSLDLVSTGAHGSTFRLLLPVRRPAGAAPAMAPRPRAPVVGPTGPALEVLVVEDDELAATVATMLLDVMGHTTHLVGDGGAAVERVRAGGIDLVLMDRHLPVMGGIAATRAIRSLGSEWSDVPIIGLTASVTAEDRAACLGAGMDDHLPKPMGLTGFREAVERLRASGRLEGGRVADRPDHAGGSDVHARLDELVAEVGVLAAVQGAVRLFLDSLTGRLELLRSAPTDEERFRAAHTLAGAAEMLGGVELGATARQLMGSDAAEVTGLIGTLERQADAFAEELDAYLAGGSTIR